MQFAVFRHIHGMKFGFIFLQMIVCAALLPAQAGFSKKSEPEGQKLFSWNLLYTGAWEENKTLYNLGDIRFSLTPPGLLLRGQALDRRTLNFELEQPFGDPAKGISSGAAALYHKNTGSRLLYGVLEEKGLPARIRSPWIRSAPFFENRTPIMADLRTSVSTTKSPEAYLYLSSPLLFFFKNSKSAQDLSFRAYSSAQITTSGAMAPAFSGGLETNFGKKVNVLLEGFYTSAELPAKKASAWFSDPPALPERDFRLHAWSAMINTPFFSASSDWAFSETFAFGSGIYGNIGLSFFPPFFKKLILSFAADGMSRLYVGRDGSSPGGGKRLAGKIERKGQRSSLFRVNTTVRGPGMDKAFNRSATGIYYRFPALSAKAGKNGSFPFKLRRVSVNAGRNASDLNKINDSIDSSIGLSLILPSFKMPAFLLPATSAKTANKPKSYPLSINFTNSLDFLGPAKNTPSPYPFFQSKQKFDSTKTSCELLWSPGIFQLRTRWAYTVFEEKDNKKKDNKWESSVSAAVRFKYGRFSIKFAWPDFPEKWNCTLSWRVNK